jgi:hypothetical protein
MEEAHETIEEQGEVVEDADVASPQRQQSKQRVRILRG